MRYMLVEQWCNLHQQSNGGIYYSTAVVQYMLDFSQGAPRIAHDFLYTCAADQNKRPRLLQRNFFRGIQELFESNGVVYISRAMVQYISVAQWCSIHQQSNGAICFSTAVVQYVCVEQWCSIYQWSNDAEYVSGALVECILDSS